MTAPGAGPDEDPDSYFLPPVPGHSPPPPQWYVPPTQRSSAASIVLKILAAVAVVAVLGFAALAVFVALAMRSYGDNK